MTGSARMIEHETPFPEAMGLSASWFICLGIGAAAAMLVGVRLPLVMPARAGLDISGSATSGFVEIELATVEFVSVGDTKSEDRFVRLAAKDDRFVDVPAKDDLLEEGIHEDLFERVNSALADRVESFAGGEAAAESLLEEKGEKTDPNTRFTLSLAASFLSSIRNLESFFGAFVCWGLRS